MYRNPYKALMGLLPQRPVLVGTVIDVSGGVATVEMPGGGVEQVRGTATVSQRVFIRDGAIEGLAPALTDVSYDI